MCAIDRNYLGQSRTPPEPARQLATADTSNATILRQHGHRRRTLPDIVARVPSEADIVAVGRDLAAALPGASRNPLKALDDKAMDLASQDAELRAALFRFVDVVPACRSLDDLARHLSGFLDEVDDRPPLAAGRDAHVGVERPGAQALGAAAAAGVQAHGPPLHRRRDARARRTGVLERLWKRRRRALASTCSARRRSPSAEADRYAARCAEALDELAEVYRRCPDRPRSKPTAPGAIPRANLSVKVSALTPLLRPDAPELGKRDAAAAPARRCCAARASSARTCTSTWSPSTRARRSPTSCSSCSPRTSSRDGPSAGLVLQAYLRDSPQLCDARPRLGAARRRRGHPLRRPPRQGRLLGPRGRRGAPARLGRTRLRGQGRLRPQLRGARRRRLLRRAGRAVRVAIASHNLRSVAHAIAANRALGGDDRDVEFQVLRGLGDDLQDGAGRSGLRVRTYCPVGDLVAGMAYLVRRLLENTSNESFLHEQAAGRPLEELLAAP